MTENASAAGRKLRDVVTGLELDLDAVRKSRRPERGAANDGDFKPVLGKEFYRVCREGERTGHLTRLAGSLIARGLTAVAASDLLLAWNARNEPPLENQKVRDTVASIARTHNRNHPPEDNLGGSILDLSAASAGRYLDAEPPPRDWVLEGVIAMGKVGQLIAPGGTGKSQLVLQFAYSIATGDGHLSPWKPGPGGKVLVLSAEDEDEELHRRIRDITLDDRTSSDGLTNLRAIRENLMVVDRVAKDNLLTHKVDREVRRTGFVDQLLEDLEQVENLRLVVLDPVSRFRGGDENDAEHATRFVEEVERLRSALGCAVLLVHHTTKSSANGEQTQHASRGSSALSDGLRFVMNLSYASGRQEPGAQLLELRLTKCSYAPAGEVVMLRRDPNGLLLPLSVVEAREHQDKERLNRLLSTIADEAREGRRYSKSTFAAKFGGPEKAYGMGQRALEGFVQRAVDLGLLEIEPGKGKYLRARAGDDRQHRA